MADPCATWAGATVILKDGKRVGWKVHRGAIPAAYEFTGRYFGGFSRDECSSESRLFDPPCVSPGVSDVFDAAVAWCATLCAKGDTRMPRQEFVVFLSPGTFVSETTERPVSSRDSAEAVQIAATICERYNATPYGFHFETRLVADPVPDGEGGVLRVEGRTVESGGIHFLRGLVETYDEVVARGDAREGILRRNMQNNNYPLVVVTDARGGHRWRSVHPFTEHDVIVDAEGTVTARGDDGGCAAYRAKKIAEWAAEWAAMREARGLSMVGGSS